MSDLYRETPETGAAETGASREPACDADSRQPYETAEPADQGYCEHTETDAEVEARIADQDELPTPQESRPATWGDNPHYHDETELGAEHNSDADAFLSGEDEHPTPQESGQATWGDNPQYHDETGLISGNDGNLGALTAKADSKGAQHAAASPDAEGTHAESAKPPEDAVGRHAKDADAATRDQGAASTADHRPDQARTDLATTKPGGAPEARDTAGPRTDVESDRPDDAGLPLEKSPDEGPPRPEKLRPVVRWHGDKQKLDFEFSDLSNNTQELTLNLISLESPEDVKEGQFGNKYDQGLGGLLDNSPHPDQPTSLPGEAHPPDSPREPGTIEVKPPGSRPDSPGHPNPNAPTAAGVELVATALVTTIWSRLFARRERKDKN